VLVGGGGAWRGFKVVDTATRQKDFPRPFLESFGVLERRRCFGVFEVGLGFLVPFLWVVGHTLTQGALVSLPLG